MYQKIIYLNKQTNSRPTVSISDYSRVKPLETKNLTTLLYNLSRLFRSLISLKLAKLPEPLPWVQLLHADLISTSKALRGIPTDSDDSSSFTQYLRNLLRDAITGRTDKSGSTGLDPAYSSVGQRVTTTVHTLPQNAWVVLA